MKSKEEIETAFELHSIKNMMDKQMKKIVNLFFVSMMLFLLGACGSSSRKDEGTQAAIDEIIAWRTRVANIDLEEGKEKYKYTEDDFSFLVYYEKDKKLYLIEAFTPYKGTPNDMEEKYKYRASDKDFDWYQNDSDFNKEKQAGNYEVVYKSGKFAD